MGIPCFYIVRITKQEKPNELKFKYIRIKNNLIQFLKFNYLK